MGDMVTGGCACGKVTYQGAASEAPGFRCYCRDCQRVTGAGHTEMLPLTAESFVVTGTLKEHQLEGGSGQPTWSGFCADCGSPLTRRSTRVAQRVYVHAGSLDAPEIYQPRSSIYTDAAQPWDPAAPDKT